MGGGAAAEVEHLLLVIEKVLGVAMRHLHHHHAHLLQTVRRGGLRGRVIVHPTIDARPRALLLHHVLAAAVRRHLAEQAVQVHLALAQHGLLEGADVAVLDVELETVHEVGLLAPVLRRVSGEADGVVGHVVLGNGAVVVLCVPHVHAALEVGQHRLVEGATHYPLIQSGHGHGALLLALAALDIVRGDHVLAATRVARNDGRLHRMTDRHGTNRTRQHLHRRVRHRQCASGGARREGVAGGLVLGLHGERTDQTCGGLRLDGSCARGEWRRDGRHGVGRQRADGEREEEVEVGGGTAAHVHDEHVPGRAVLLRVNGKRDGDSTERERAVGTRALDAVDEEQGPQNHALVTVRVGTYGRVEDVSLHVGAPRVATMPRRDEALGNVLQLEQELGQRGLCFVNNRKQQRHLYRDGTAVCGHHRDSARSREHVMNYG